ncbi:unnamed protein product [[Candida] boidinii]|uniref:Unnamed protein product n=1 Tax=Candida boidinii TaxID=5477 RepID=A0A9W6WHF5_CANBO|nr:hypothetical protein B5S30_g103 [[Candida] boidinii]OWB86461.1 hypothetical protein B5S33_g5158 [[Candida] boidinii]GME73069.1 unnamed protein product [[Candida] boidinii]GMF52679.1 unnamed protein product [[Candida] boidinii]GMG12544.1 unnamed protein product [[Candida] boidinii]
MARQNFIGFVVSQGKMDKTIKVRVLQKVFNKKVHKEFFKRKDYLVHDQANICREGDMVRIEATRPLSARKFFAVAEIKRNKGQEFIRYQTEAKDMVNQEEREKAIDFLKRRDIIDETKTDSLYNDLNEIKDLKKYKNLSELSEEDQTKILKLKEKYYINTNWENDSILKESIINKENDLFETDLVKISNKLSDLNLSIKLNSKISELINDESSETFKIISTKMNITNETKKNIKKNLIKKFLKTTPNDELIKLGIVI